jgi:hypothetical protein
MNCIHLDDPLIFSIFVYIAHLESEMNCIHLDDPLIFSIFVYIAHLESEMNCIHLDDPLIFSVYRSNCLALSNILSPDFILSVLNTISDVSFVFHLRSNML